MDSGQPRRLLLITYPRTASNLLVRILGLKDQPDVVSKEQGGYYFLPPYILTKKLELQRKPVKDWTQEERDAIKKSYQESANELGRHIEKAEAEGKLLFVKEHSILLTEPTAKSKFSFGCNATEEQPWTFQAPGIPITAKTRSNLNQTVFSDDFLASWSPIFLIRHPALAFPSYFRTYLDNYGAEGTEVNKEHIEFHLTISWSRTLYDWYVQYFEKRTSASNDDITWPLILDADDLMMEPGVIVRFCDIVGMDSTKLQFSWKPATEQELAQYHSDAVRRMLSTLTASTGIVEGKTSANLDIDAEAKKWKEEFGEQAGTMIEDTVRTALPDYEYMKARRLRSRPVGLSIGN